ncbi:hypothetical protein PZA11_001657 [Diplocarpon coronariae]
MAASGRFPAGDGGTPDEEHELAQPPTIITPRAAAQDSAPSTGRHEPLLILLALVRSRAYNDKYSRGEKTAERLESNLTKLERKIDDLLASCEESERKRLDHAHAEKAGAEPSGAEGDGKA